MHIGALVSGFVNILVSLTNKRIILKPLDLFFFKKIEILEIKPRFIFPLTEFDFKCIVNYCCSCGNERQAVTCKHDIKTTMR